MIQLINGDCLEEMKKISDGSIDLVLTDPPYGTTACKWDTIIPFEPMWEQLKRVTKKNGAIVLFGSEPFSSHLRMSNLKMYKYDIKWEKEKVTNVFMLKRQIGRVIEDITIFYNVQPTYNPQMYKAPEHLIDKRKTYNYSTLKNGVFGKGGMQLKRRQEDGLRYPKNIIKISRERNSLHPTQKPVALMEYLIKTYTNEGETVLDFTAGSFTTGVACVNIGRNFIGIEKDKTYFDIGTNRIKETIKCLDLKIEPTIITGDSML